MAKMSSVFQVDILSLVMAVLILFVSVCVGSFSWRYLRGDRAQGQFYGILGLLVLSVLILVSADHLALFVVAWGASNFFLARLMVHKRSWPAARESGWLMMKNSVLGLAALTAAAVLLYAHTGETSIQELTARAYPPALLAAVVSLIFLAVATQSALWPFHRWLTSSLNSPTPVSAFMHAGLVNGGGFLLARFAPLYLQQPDFFKVIFLAGFMTALLGTLWKLMQNDVKRMLACSTMGQMGFMIAQCGLGLFPAAIAHLVWHGLFKAYLFLASGAAAQEKRLDLGYPPSRAVFCLSVVCGVLGAGVFSRASQIDPTAFDTRLFLVGMSFIAASQLAMSVLRGGGLRKLPMAMGSTLLAGLLYGLSVSGFDALFPHLLKPHPLGGIHVIAFLFLVLGWMGILFAPSLHTRGRPPKWMLRLYVWMLNASQPHPKTVTAHRNDYQYQ